MEWLESRAVRPRQARSQAALRPDIVIIDCSVLLEVASTGGDLWRPVLLVYSDRPTVRFRRIRRHLKLVEHENSLQNMHWINIDGRIRKSSPRAGQDCSWSFAAAGLDRSHSSGWRPRAIRSFW